MLFLFLGLIGLIIWIYNIQERIITIEQALKNKKKSISLNFSEKTKTTKKIEEGKKEIDFQPWEDSENTTKKKGQSITLKEKESFKLEDFLGRKFFSILGILSIVIAVGFFATWAFSNGLIGPKGRIALGILFGLGLLVTGELMKGKYPKFFTLISSGGIASLLIVTFIARDFYNFLSPDQSFVAYVIEIGAGILLALRYDSRVLGNFSILGGLLAPILVQSPEPNAIGLLSYLSVLSVAGFIVSTQKNWSEIVWVLFLGIIGFEIGIFDQGLLKESPLLFLAFIYGLHLLLGSGGIIRSLREKVVQTTALKMNDKSVYEILLFVVSIFTVNGLGYSIFDQQEWGHFGFFVLAQGFLFFGLSEFLKSRHLFLFQKICVSATLLSILFATIWEMGGQSQFVLTMMLVGEGVLFCFAGSKVRDGFIGFFGRLALVVASFECLEIDSFSENTVAMLALVPALLYSVGRPEKKWEKIWGGIATFVVSGHIFNWSFNEWGNLLPETLDFAVFMVPVIWGGGLAYSFVRSKSILSQISGGIVLLIINVVLWNKISWELSHDDNLWYVSLLALNLVLIGNFVVLSCFFIHDKTYFISKEIRKNATKLVLAVSTISVFNYGAEFLDEPIRTLAWILWGGVLLGFGFKRAWPHFRYFGIGIFCFIISKLYLVDVWEWEIWVRFIAFLVLGIALLSTSFLYQKFTQKK